MNALPEAVSAAPADFDARISYLQFIADFLLQFTRTSEALELRQMAYFLSMAATEARDQLNALRDHTANDRSEPLPAVA